MALNMAARKSSQIAINEQMFISMHKGKTREFTQDSISVIDMAKKNQLKEERDYNDLYEGLPPEDIEYL